jgi:hypothetical protein
VDVAQDAATSGFPDSHRTVDASRTPPDAAPDIAPLAELLADVTRRNEELSAAAALWQYRAMQAEERLAQLEAGPIAGETSTAVDSPQERAGATERDDQPVKASEGLMDRIRRLIGR